MELSKTEKELCHILRKILTDRDDYLGTMVCLTIQQKDPEGNCKQLLDFIKANPHVTRDEIYDKTDEILGLDPHWEDEDALGYYEDDEE